MLDARLSFKKHIEYAKEKASKACAALSRIMPNARGARQGRRLLLAGVVKSILLYGSPIWADAMRCKTYRQKLESVYRLSALRVCSAFRTTSNDAILVVGSMAPIDLLVNEERYRFERKEEDTRKEGREKTIATWQERWNTSAKGRWTYRLIPNISSWIERQHGDVDFYVSQLLTGHGCFRQYLNKFGHDSTPHCTICPDKIEDAEHTFFECPQFHSERELLCKLIGVRVKPENIVQLMLSSQSNWDAVAFMAETVMKKLRRQERSRNSLVPTIA